MGVFLQFQNRGGLPVAVDKLIKMTLGKLVQGTGERWFALF